MKLNESIHVTWPSCTEVALMFPELALMFPEVALMFPCFHFWCIWEWNSCNNISFSIKMQNSLLAKIGLVQMIYSFNGEPIHPIHGENKLWNSNIWFEDVMFQKCFGQQDDWITRLPWCPSIRVILITWFFLFPLIRIGNLNKYLHEHGFEWQFNGLLSNSHLHMGATFW
jgi:hypothetical protein